MTSEISPFNSKSYEYSLTPYILQLAYQQAWSNYVSCLITFLLWANNYRFIGPLLVLEFSNFPGRSYVSSSFTNPVSP